MVSFSLDLSKDYQRPIIKVDKIDAIIDTGAMIPTFSLPAPIIEAFNARPASDYREELAKKNIAKRMGVSSYSELVNARVHEEQKIVTEASKRKKRRKVKVPNYNFGGDVYVMLGRKIRVK